MIKYPWNNHTGAINLYLKGELEYNSFALSSCGFHSSYSLSTAELILNTGFSGGIADGKSAEQLTEIINRKMGKIK